MVLIWEFLNDVVSQIDNQLTILSVGNYSNGTQEITVKDVKFFDLKKRVNEKKATRNGNVITITGLTEELTINSEVRIDLPIFLDGTLTNTKYEWSVFEKDEFKKLPFIWLVSPTHTKEHGIEQGGNYSIDVTLWFVHRSDWGRSNAYRQSQTMKPLSSLVDAFKVALQNNLNVTQINQLDYRDFPKWGTLGKDGIEKGIFDSKLSAFEVNISFDLLKCCNFG